MATQLQDLQAKRKELQATNPNATMLDAKSALSPTPIANAPVAGVAPAITLTTPTAPVAPSVHSGGMSPTEQANRDILAKNQTTAPVAPTVTPEVTTPTTPTVTPTETPTVAPTVAPEPTVQVASQAVQAPTPTQAVKSPTQATNKAILEQNKLKPPSTRDIALSNKLGQYSAMTSQQFVDLMKQGQIPSTVSSQLVANPQFQQAQQEYSRFLKTNNINNSGRAVYNAMIGGQPEQAVNPLVEISNNLLKAFGVDGTQQSYLDAFKESISQNEAVRTKTLELNAKNAQIDEKVQARDNILKDLKATHQGVPLSTLVAMASRDAQPINDEITTLQRDVKQLSSDLQFETELAKSEYDAKTKDMEAKTNIRNTILGNLMNAQFGLATKQMETTIAEDIAKKAFNNPLLAIPAMIDEYKKLNIPFDRSTQEIVADFQVSGQDLASYLTDIQKTIQEKPEYLALKKYQADQIKIKQNEAPTTKDIEVGGKKVTVQWDGKEWKPVQGANIERGIATQTYGTTPAVRNFNPGNIMDTGFGGRKVEGERFTVFDSPQEGFNALVAKIQNIQNGGSKVYSPDMTLLQYIGKYAPSSDGNNPQSYATAIANNLGVSINTKIGQIDPVKLAEEHARHEDGNSYKMLQDLGVIGGKGGGQDIKMQALSLTQGLGGTADERQMFTDNIIKVAQRDNISLADAKKKLGYKSGDDTEFAKTRKEDIQSLKKDTRDKLSNANTALTLLSQPQTAIGDVASVVGFLKTIDPASVARESEVQSVENARGIIDSLSNTFAKLKEGTKLTDTQRTQLKQAIQTIVDAGNSKYYDAIYNTSQEFNDRGLDPTVYISKNDVAKAEQMFNKKQEQAPQNDIMTVVNNLVPESYRKYFQ